ncbi:hypothetical protein DL93DRAFT_2165175 [Clavulina sp. PMI_390]|nr:hypothetical protein DL93DRAFT_2165175 [Clavulina sp. PMI_390]
MNFFQRITKFPDRTLAGMTRLFGQIPLWMARLFKKPPIIQKTTDFDEEPIYDVPKIPAWICGRLSIGDESDVSQLSESEQTSLLNRLYDDLQNYLDSPERIIILRCLQDLCYHFSSLPNSFKLQGVTFSRSQPMSRGGEATLYRGQMGELQVVVRELFLTVSDWNTSDRERVAKLVTVCASRSYHPFTTSPPNILPFLGVYLEDSISPPLTIVPYIDGGSLQGLLTPKALIDTTAFQRIVSETSFFHHISDIATHCDPLTSIK